MRRLGWFRLRFRTMAGILCVISVGSVIIFARLLDKVHPTLWRSAMFLLVAGNAVSATHVDGSLYPQDSESRETKLLDGIWDFRIAPQLDCDQGFRERWFLKPLAQTGGVIGMPVPASYNDITQNSSIRDHVGWAWYDTHFYVPKRWADGQQRIFLRFGSVHYYATVWLNGVYVTDHIGGHLPFHAEITKLVRFSSSNFLTVAVNNTLTPLTIPQGEIVHETDTTRFPPGYFTQQYTFDFFNYAGIHRHVSLFTTPQVYINDITIVTDFQQPNTGIVKYSMSVFPESATFQVTCQVRLLDKNGVIVAKGSDLQGKLKIADPHLWWPFTMHPDPGYLYTLEVQIHPLHGEDDVYRIRVGIRSVSWNETAFMINGKQFYFRGVGKHEDSNIRGKGLDYPLLVKDFNLLKWLGANSFRTSHYPYAEEIMARADEEGIVVIDESPAVDVDIFDKQLLDRHLIVMQELIQRDKNHPSVVMWSLANEPRTQRAPSGPYFRQVAERTKALDPSRPVTLVTNRDLTEDYSAEYMDIICINRYYGWYSSPGHLEIIQLQLVGEMREWHQRFRKPIMIAEYGADTIAGFHADPPSLFTEDYQTAFLNHHFKAFDTLRHDGFFAGEMVWNFADFMTVQGVRRVNGNKKGVFTRERQPKASARVLRLRYYLLALAVDNYTSFPSELELSCPAKSCFV